MQIVKNLLGRVCCMNAKDPGAGEGEKGWQGAWALGVMVEQDLCGSYKFRLFLRQREQKVIATQHANFLPCCGAGLDLGCAHCQVSGLFRVPLLIYGTQLHYLQG